MQHCDDQPSINLWLKWLGPVFALLYWQSTYLLLAYATCLYYSLIPLVCMQHCDDQPSVNLRLKWLGLFHRDKYTPGTQQLKTPYTSGLRPHTLVL